MGYRLFGKYAQHASSALNFCTNSHSWLLFTVIASMFCSLAGCSAMSGAKDSWHYSGMWNDMMMGYRNEAWANKAWHSRKHQFCREKHLHEFCEGFRAGYALVTEGGDGCTPAYPPRQYWGWKYQSAEGQEKVAAWYSGYPHGARAAEEDGIGNWTQIQTSTTVQQRYADQGMLGPGQSVGLYPMPEAQPIAAVNAAKLKAPTSESQSSETLISEGSPSVQPPSGSGQYLKK